MLGLVLMAGLPAVARGQAPTYPGNQPRPPLEDVVLRGQIVRADGSPLANWPVGVNAYGAGGGVIDDLFFNGGDDSIKHYDATTDPGGNYSFRFPLAHHRGEETNTDYVLRVETPSTRYPDQTISASYELELIDAVQDAPVLRMWDPEVRAGNNDRVYFISYGDWERKARERTNLDRDTGVFLGERSWPEAVDDASQVDARVIQDTPVTLGAYAHDDVFKRRTIYHQRFRGARVHLQGSAVPLSRDKRCTVVPAGVCHLTDGDLTTKQSFTQAIVDLGQVEAIGEVRDGCDKWTECTITLSSDGNQWRDLSDDDNNHDIWLNMPAFKARFVRVTGPNISTAEISVWSRWQDVEPLPRLGGSRAGKGSEGDGASRVPAALLAIALAALCAGPTIYLRRKPRSKGQRA